MFGDDTGAVDDSLVEITHLTDSNVGRSGTPLWFEPLDHFTLSALLTTLEWALPNSNERRYVEEYLSL